MFRGMGNGELRIGREPVGREDRFDRWDRLRGYFLLSEDWMMFSSRNSTWLTDVRKSCCSFHTSSPRRDWEIFGQEEEGCPLAAGWEEKRWR